jgi:hypothetical protein
VPISIANIIVVAFLLKLTQAIGLAPAPDRANDFIANLPQMLILLLGNVALLAVIGQLLRNAGRRARQIGGEIEPTPAELEDEVAAVGAHAAH